ncbi:hypothetical protein HELRODRAFT_104183 [Helobdella robusta]|uniref:Fibronectin type-III domain-containing protein n=1 Tax=Helobdella robusta TaxID=6412 RepID=T1EDK2_HELRO|nr:hypothetical protein HELRODRAFT_104183 [Helobdella robusta]ESN91224.1 hypothetical protein HELRODRAFT_104183 [Helobdella robusta]
MSPVHSFTTLPTIPETPSGPKLVAKTKTSLQLKWNSVPDNGSKIASYLLECDQGRSEFIEVYNGPQKQFKITKLLPSIKYSFRLAAVNSCGKSEYSDPVSYQTSGSPPCQTDPPLLSEPTSKTLVISWNKRPSDLVFTLQMDDESTGHGFLTVYNGPDISYRVTGLKRNSEYKFRLQSQNDEGYSKWSDIVCFKTLPDRPQPPSKPVLKMKPSSTFFKIQWDEPRDLGGISISHYIVHLLKNQAYEEYSTVQDKEVCVENLTPGCTYKVKIQAAGNGGVSEYSDMLTVTTQAVPPSPCKQPKLCGGKPKPSHFSITWDPPDNDGGAAVAEYVVMIKMVDRGEVVNDNEESRSQDVYRGADTYCTIAGLAAGRLHEVFVKSYNKAGWSEWSDPLRVTTGCSSPDPPSPPVVTCRSPYSCTLNWTAPNNNGAEITEYRLFGKLIKEESNGKMEDLGIHTEVLSKISAETDEDFVMALNNVGSSFPSLSSTCQTLPGCPSSVISLKVDQVKATSCTLSWKRPRSNGSSILSYNLDLVGFKIISIEEDLCTVTINELTPDTLYKARIQAINNVGCSPYGSVIKFSTISLPPLSPKLEMVSCSAKFVKLKWGDGKNNDHTKYILEIAENGENYGQIYEGTNHSFKVNKLNELTEYHFRIQAFNDAGAGPISDPIIITTSKSPPPPVKAPHIANISTTTCKIMWPSIKITGCQDDIQYNLQLLRPSDSSFQQIYQGPLCSFELFDLAPNCEYQTRVCAIRKQSSSRHEIVVGPYSPTTAFNTKVNIGSASPSSQPKKCLPSSSLRVSYIDGYFQVKWLNDKTCAIAIMTIFLMIALVVSYIVSHYMSFQFPSSFSSISPSSS